MNDVLLALQERMTMQIAVDGATLLLPRYLQDIIQPVAEDFSIQQQCHEDSYQNAQLVGSGTRSQCRLDHSASA